MMRATFRGTAIASMCLFAMFALDAATLEAQASRVFQPAVSQKGECPQQLTPPPTDADLLKRCANALAADVGLDLNGPIAEPPLLPLVSQSPRDTHAALLHQYAAYLTVKNGVEKALKDKSSKPSVEESLKDTLAKINRIGEINHAELQQHELEKTAPITGELRAGAAITSAGSSNGASGTAENGGTSALAHIVWQTPHYHAIDRLSGWDYSLEGKFGAQPALTVLKAQNGQQTEDQSGGQPENEPALAARYQQGLVLDVGLTANYFTGSSEWSVVGRGGFVRLGQLAQVIEEKGSTYLAFPAGSEDQVAPYFEIAGRVALFERKMPFVHSSMEALSPRLMGEFAYRRDSRFAQADGEVLASGREQRMIVRFLIDGLNVMDKTTDPASNKVFTIGFGFEYQRGWNGGGIPPGFSLVIRGDADLLRVLQGGHTEPSPATAQALTTHSTSLLR